MPRQYRSRPGHGGRVHCVLRLAVALALGVLAVGAHAPLGDASVAALTVIADSTLTHGPTCDEPSPTPLATPTSRTSTRQCGGTAEPLLTVAALLVAAAPGFGPERSTRARLAAYCSAGRHRLTLLKVDRN